MRKLNLIMIGFILVFQLSSLSRAAIVDISVETDKDTYLLDEDVFISVTAYNPNAEAITLGFGFYQSSYMIDGVYDWAEGRTGPAVLTDVTIEPYDSFSWNLSHGINERLEYPLDVGIHTLVGEVLAGELLALGESQSPSIEFEVIPEPTTALLFGVGLLWIRKNKL